MTNDKKKKWVAEPNYCTKKQFSGKLLAFEIKLMYLRLLVLYIGKIAMYKYCYDYVKLNYEKKTILFSMDKSNFIDHVKSEEIYAELAGDVKKKFDTSNY